MNRQHIEDDHIVARYLADQLSDAEREAFEAYYLEHPEIVQEMEAAARFKVGLAQLKDSGQLDALMKPTPLFRQERFMGIAASVAIVGLGAFLAFHRGPSSQPTLVASAAELVDRLGDPLPMVATRPIMRMRSTAADLNIQLPSSPQTIALRVLPEFETTPLRYRIALASIGDDESLHPVAKIGGLAPDAEGFVPVFLNSTKLSSGRYELALSADAGTSAENEPPSSFLIQVMDDAS